MSHFWKEPHLGTENHTSAALIEFQYVFFVCVELKLVKTLPGIHMVQRKDIKGNINESVIFNDSNYFYKIYLFCQFFISMLSMYF